MLKQMSGRTFSNLLSYYIACLEQEDMLSVTFKVSSEGTAFLSTLVQTELLFHTNNKQVMVKNTEGIQKFFQTSLLQQQNKTLFYGYPVVITPEGTISPLFFIELQYEQQGEFIGLTNLSPQLNVNRYLFSKQHFSDEEILYVQQEIEDEAFPAALDSICKTLHLNATDCSPTLDKTPFRRTSMPKLLNKAIVYFGERTDITRSLIVELSQLKKKPLDDLASSALLWLLTGDYQPHDINSTTEPFLEIYPLNPAQEYAVHHSLQRPLTVITGPPGTGKTQVVLNIIANAVYQNKTVLFASKNNKAVDVVTEKFHTVLPYNLLVRMGNLAHRRSTKTEIEHLIRQSIKRIPFRQKVRDDLMHDGSQIASGNNQISNLSTLNESLANLQNMLDSLREQLPSDLIVHRPQAPLEQLDPIMVQEDLEKFFHKQGMGRWFHPRRYQQKQQECFKKYYDMLPSNLKTYMQHMISIKHTTLEVAFHWILLLKKAELTSEEIKKIKKTILAFPPYTTLNDQVTSSHKKYISTSRAALNQHWINKFADANETDTNHIQAYFTTCEHHDAYNVRSNINRQYYQKQQNTFQKILKVLPAWVVTNLSVRQSVPLQNNLFDILIIDEASQCDIASALPLFYRAKQLVIIGDPQQLKHISQLTETQDKSLATTNGVTDEMFYVMSYTKYSLYDLVEHVIQTHDEDPLLLNEHYRCHREIVSFSNQYYYGQQLTIATDERKLLNHPTIHTRILWHHIKGKTIHSKSPYNEQEAERVVEELLRLLTMVPTLNASIGIVSLFRAQSEIITEKLKKFHDIVETDITIGTAHRFQGDERDIILFSPAVSEGVKPGTLHWIQTTNQLINVAVTRARSLFIIVGDREVCKRSTGPLKNLSDYVEMTTLTQGRFESQAKQILSLELRKQGIPIVTNYLVKGNPPYRIDFALFVNGNRFAIGMQEEQRTLNKRQLRKDGWNIRLFCEQDIQDNLENVVEEIKRFC